MGRLLWGFRDMDKFWPGTQKPAIFTARNGPLSVSSLSCFSSWTENFNAKNWPPGWLRCLKFFLKLVDRNRGENTIFKVQEKHDAISPSMLVEIFRWFVNFVAGMTSAYPPSPVNSFLKGASASKPNQILHALRLGRPLSTSFSRLMFWPFYPFYEVIHVSFISLKWWLWQGGHPKDLRILVAIGACVITLSISIIAEAWTEKSFSQKKWWHW